MIPLSNRDYLNMKKLSDQNNIPIKKLEDFYRKQYYILINDGNKRRKLIHSERNIAHSERDIVEYLDKIIILYANFNKIINELDSIIMKLSDIKNLSPIYKERLTKAISEISLIKTDHLTELHNIEEI